MPTGSFVVDKQAIFTDKKDEEESWWSKQEPENLGFSAGTPRVGCEVFAFSVLHPGKEFDGLGDATLLWGCLVVWAPLTSHRHLTDDQVICLDRPKGQQTCHLAVWCLNKWNSSLCQVWAGCSECRWPGSGKDDKPRQFWHQTSTQRDNHTRDFDVSVLPLRRHHC